MNRIELVAALSLAKDSSRRVNVVASKEIPDRDGDIIRLSGMDLEQYRANPVVLNQHQQQEPIGKAVDVRIVGDELRAELELARNEKGGEVLGLIKSGVLSGISIGFLSKQAAPRQGMRGWDITASELLEISTVSVPANSAALVQRSKELSHLVLRRLR